MIAVYVRVSTREQMSGYGIDSQLEHLNNYLINNSHDLNEVRYYEDPGFSANSVNRPQLKKLFKDIEDGIISKLFIYKLDRLFRNLRDLHLMLDFFDSYGVEFRCITEMINKDTAHGRFQLNLTGALAELERDQVSERTFDGLVQSAINGNYSIGNVPIGYIKVPNENGSKGKRLEINLIEAETVKRIFDMKSNGYGVPLILTTLISENTLNRKWTENMVYSTIKNKIYYGTFEKFGITIENHSPAIITKEQWERANQMKYRKNKNTYLLDKLAIHKECGAECTNTTGTGRLGQLYYYLKCSKCGKYFSETKIIQMLEVAYGGFVNQMNSYNAPLKLKEINNQRDDLVSMYTRKLISGESFIKASSRLDEMAQAEQLKEKNISVYD